jgi:cyclic beta-1,2-glucan synthetase
LPVRELDAYRARHGQGYTEFEHNSHAIEQVLLTLVPLHTGDPDPIRVQRLRIRNASARRRRLSVTSYAELVLGTDHEKTQMHIACVWDEKAKALFARNPYHPDYAQRVTFAAIAGGALSYTSDRTEFLGRNGSPEAPAALRRVSLSNRAGCRNRPLCAIQTKFEIEPGEEKTVILLLGQADDATHARQLVAQYGDPAAVDAAFAQTRRVVGHSAVEDSSQHTSAVGEFHDEPMAALPGVELPHLGRSALYQSSGAYGFRDQLQDALAFVYSAPEVARQMILHAASRQFVEGDVQHWWHLPSGSGLRSRCSDDLLWLPFAVSHYVEKTGDTTLLDTSNRLSRRPAPEGRRIGGLFPACSFDGKCDVV